LSGGAATAESAPDFASFSPGFELALEQRTSGEGTAAKTQNTSLPHTAVTTAAFVTHKQYFIENGSINEIFLLHIFIDGDGTRVVAVKVASWLSGSSPGAATSETNFLPLLLINELLVSGRFCGQDIEQRQKRWT
jgi:hypothetical protein